MFPKKRHSKNYWTWRMKCMLALEVNNNTGYGVKSCWAREEEKRRWKAETQQHKLPTTHLTASRADRRLNSLGGWECETGESVTNRKFTAPVQLFLWLLFSKRKLTINFYFIHRNQTWTWTHLPWMCQTCSTWNINGFTFDQHFDRAVKQLTLKINNFQR